MFNKNLNHNLRISYKKKDVRFPIQVNQDSLLEHQN